MWALLTDFSRMPDWSPELVKMLPMKPGGLRVGQWYLGDQPPQGASSGRPAAWSPSSEPGRTLAWDTKSSGARWIWELERTESGTRVVHRRPVPDGITVMSKLFAPTFLGGSDGHADELEAGMAETVARLKAAAES